MDNRERLPEGFKLYCASRVYTIEKYISSGSNSIVYQAGYEDTLIPEHVHSVLIKELYPLDLKGGITRDASMNLCVQPEAEAFFAYHKTSFLLGNQAHLALSDGGSGYIAENQDSFEENGTLYTVLAARKGKVLSEMQENGEKFPALTEAVTFIKNLLLALTPFHTHNLLHLDVSPDNIFLLSPETDGKFPEDVLLLDFNSVYSLGSELNQECMYYLGKKDYMAPEVALHRKEELGPWTDIYSVCAVFYEILAGEKLPADRELLDLTNLISPYSPLLLHEKERSAEHVNRILKKGLQILPAKRYQGTDEMLEDIQELLDELNGLIRLSEFPPKGGRQGNNSNITDKPKRGRAKTWLVIVLAAALSVETGLLVYPHYLRQKQAMEDTTLDLTKFPLEIDDSIMLSQKNARRPLDQNILQLQVRDRAAVQINLKDYEYSRDLSDVFETYLIYCVYNGRDDKRGWQDAELYYDFFFTPDNTMHMVLPFQDTNDFDLEYLGVVFANFNYTETSALLDITKCTLTDGAGNSYEMTELLGSHVIFFDENDWQWNLLTMQNKEVVSDFKEIYGGNLTVDAAVGFLDSILEVRWESDNPEIATVDDKGHIQALRRGTATLTVSIENKDTGEIKQTQMLVYVKENPQFSY